MSLGKKQDKNILSPNENFIILKKQVVNEFVAFKINEEAVVKGYIVLKGTVDDQSEAFGIKTLFPVCNGTDGIYNKQLIFKCEKGTGLLFKNKIDYLHLNRDGTVKNDKSLTIKKGMKGKHSQGECVSVMIGDCTKYGKVINVEEINGILCYEIDFNPNGSMSKVIVIENDILDDEVKDPIEHNVHVYFKKEAYVQLSAHLFGVVKKYILHNKVFYYLVETDTGVSKVGLKEVTYGLDLDLQGHSFLTIDDPENYGIITSLKKGSVVQLIKKNHHGHISWMGFDGRKEFKFGLTLEERNGFDENGTYYNQTLFVADRGYAALVSTFEVAPDGRFPQEEKRRTKPSRDSQFEGSYQQIMYKIRIGDGCGIQGNLNSCYMDTSIFAMFAFNRFVDTIITEEKHIKDEKVKNLQIILRRNIVYPLRKHHYVAYDKVTEFREQLQKVDPNSKFVMNERDPEELIETLFHLLTPEFHFLRTKRFNDIYEQRCFLTQLFYQHDSGKRNLNVKEMLTLTFLESEMLISKPPKGLILQLPRHGRDLKRFKTVKIPLKMDITEFIVACHRKCTKCQKEIEKINLCIECSMKDYDMRFYCDDHTNICQHDILKMDFETTPYNGNVELELVAILCIERTHYIAYAKTNESSGKWIYFNSMEKLEDGEFIPHTRETTLDQYFRDSKFTGDHMHQSDVEKIENYAFVCFYKNPTLEMYTNDFNSFLI